MWVKRWGPLKIEGKSLLRNLGETQKFIKGRGMGGVLGIYSELIWSTDRLQDSLPSPMGS